MFIDHSYHSPNIFPFHLILDVKLPAGESSPSSSSLSQEKPMQLGRAQVTSAECFQRLQLVECLHCGQSGDFLAFCTSLPKDVTRHQQQGLWPVQSLPLLNPSLKFRFPQLSVLTNCPSLLELLQTVGLKILFQTMNQCYNLGFSQRLQFPPPHHQGNRQQVISSCNSPFRSPRISTLWKSSRDHQV